MSRHDVVIIKETHRGLLYEDGVLKDVLPAGRHRIARGSGSWTSRLGLGRRAPVAEVVLVDVRKADRTVPVADVLTADRATISASFAVQYRVIDPRSATHEVRNPGERLGGEVQTAARRLLRGMTLDEIVSSREEIGEELLRLVAESASRYGIEVNGLDLKDLALPDEYRETLNRAAFAKVIRRVQPIEVWGDERSRDAAEADLIPMTASSFGDDPTLPFPRSHEPIEASAAEALAMPRRAASE